MKHYYYKCCDKYKNKILISFFDCLAINIISKQYFKTKPSSFLALYPLGSNIAFLCILRDILNTFVYFIVTFAT